MERARVAEHAPNIPEFVPSLGAQQLPGLPQVTLGFWVVQEKWDSRHVWVGTHINPPGFVDVGGGAARMPDSDLMRKLTEEGTHHLQRVDPPMQLPIEPTPDPLLRLEQAHGNQPGQRTRADRIDAIARADAANLCALAKDPGTFSQRIMRRKRFFNAMMSMLCGPRHAIPPPGCVGYARLPTVGRDGAVQIERPLPAQPQRAGDGGAGAAAGGQRMPNRCRQCGCEKCSGKNTTCTQEQRQAWCTQNGWDRHWQADADGQGNSGMRGGPRPSKSKLLQCVRCEREQLSCWGRHAD
jgi:hypothetical protein